MQSSVAARPLGLKGGAGACLLRMRSMETESGCINLAYVLLFHKSKHGTGSL